MYVYMFMYVCVVTLIVLFAVVNEDDKIHVFSLATGSKNPQILSIHTYIHSYIHSYIHTYIQLIRYTYCIFIDNCMHKYIVI